jgi:hypothetical protein
MATTEQIPLLFATYNFLGLDFFPWTKVSKIKISFLIPRPSTISNLISNGRFRAETADDTNFFMHKQALSK